MKLLSKTSVYYFLFALPLFAICTLFIYSFISGEIKDNLDESLWKQKTILEQKLNNGVDVKALNDDEIKIDTLVNSKTESYSLIDTNLYENIEDEILPYRLLKSQIKLQNGAAYEISIMRSYVESDDVIASILAPIILLFIILFAGILSINIFISKKVWKPFHQSIEKLKSFKLDHAAKIEFDKSTILEFNELNSSLNNMILKAGTDYQKQKEFTENASHEIQTPLAIIQNKIELLIQSNKLGAEEMEIITAIYETVNRLSHLNKTLLLLTKIENHQFTDNKEFNLNEVILKNLNTLSDLAEHRQLKIKMNLLDSVKIKMNPILCDSLISNLLVNAIRHNVECGQLNIELNSKQLLISNSGSALTISSDEIFQRFKKSSASHESSGLGLSIVDSICKQYAITISHTHSDGLHQFVLNL